MSSNTNNQRINFASIKNPMKYPDFLEVQLSGFFGSAVEVISRLFAIEYTA